MAKCLLLNLKVFIRSNYLFLLVPIFSYLLFFYPALNPQNAFYSGKDAVKYHYPTKYYIYESLHSGRIPFWTERMYGGFPLYRELERGVLNIPNLILVFLAGPIQSYKILHFLTYMLGSVSLLVLLKKITKVNLQGFIVAHTVYFFSFFHIYHQQHFNLLLTTYLYPLGILLIYKYIETKRDLYTFLNAVLISYLFYGGSTQFVFILLVLEFIFLVFYYQSLSVKILLKYYLKFLPLVVILIIPALSAGLSLYQNSLRAGDFNYREGSFSPAMLLNVIYPFLFNREASYLGFTLSNDFSIQETYMYSGLAAVACALIALLVLEDVKTKRFSITIIITFLFLAMIKFIPPFNLINLPVFSMFRYWTRFVIVLDLVLAILCASFITKLTGGLMDKELRFRKLLILVYPAIALLLLELLWERQSYGISLLRFLVKNNQEFRPYNLVYIAVIAGLIIFIALIKAKKFRIAGILITFLITADLIFFGKLASDYEMFKNVTDLFDRCSISPQQRTLDLSGCINGNTALLHKSWGLLGSGALIPKDVGRNLSLIGSTSTRQLNLEKGFDPQNPTYQEPLKVLGVWYIYNGESDTVQLNNSYFKSGNYLIENEHAEEGKFSATFTTTSNVVVSTYIRYDLDWKIFVDGRAVKVNKNDRNFLTIPINPGTHEVFIKYTPTGLYLAYLLSTVLVIVYFGVVKLIQRGSLVKN